MKFVLFIILALGCSASGIFLVMTFFPVTLRQNHPYFQFHRFLNKDNMALVFKLCRIVKLCPPIVREAREAQNSTAYLTTGFKNLNISFCKGYVYHIVKI